MFFIKKQQLYNLIFAVILLLSAVINFRPSFDVTETASPPVSGRVIVIDAGHGTPDGGAVGLSGTLEKDLNLEVAKSLGNFLEQSGAFVVYTRYDDNSIADDLDKSIREIKRSDLNNRKNIKANSGADMFISIHMNKFSDSQYKGAQVFYAQSPDESKVLAEKIQNKIKEIADNTNVREAKSDNNSIFILKNSNIPSVVVECGFLSNEEEEFKLKTKEYRDKIAFAVFAGINDYLTRN